MYTEPPETPRFPGIAPLAEGIEHPVAPDSLDFEDAPPLKSSRNLLLGHADPVP